MSYWIKLNNNLKFIPESHQNVFIKDSFGMEHNAYLNYDKVPSIDKLKWYSSRDGKLLRFEVTAFKLLETTKTKLLC